MVFLKHNIKAEPLIWKWYAWPHLISPATAACNITDRHIKILSSFIQAPKVHVQAGKDPKMLGGPFMNVQSDKVERIKDLLTETRDICSNLISLSGALKSFDRELQSLADGSSMEHLYGLIPTELKGLIELVYDLNNHASLRLIEHLFYSKYYSDQCQEIALSHNTADFRPFVLSTPRLETDGEVYLKIPFMDQRLDLLFSMRHTSRALSEIKKVLDIHPAKMDLFDSFFTNDAPKLPDDRNYLGKGVRIRYLGHACVLLETNNVSIIFDPVLSYSIEGDVPRFTLEDLPDSIEYVVFTHNHQDHVLIETLLQIRHKVKNIVVPSNSKGNLADPSLKLIMHKLGFNNLIVLDEFDSVKLVNGEIRSIPFLGEHCDLNIQSKSAYYVQLENKKLLFAADSNNIDNSLYEHIFAEIGAVDIVFIGMECEGAPLSWLYGPLLSSPLSRVLDKSRSLSGSNFDKAFKIVQQSKCKQAYVYAMGQEPWLNYIMALKYEPDSIQIIESERLINACRELGIVSERLFGKKEWII